MCEDIVDSNIDDLLPEKGGRLSNCFELVDYGGRLAALMELMEKSDTDDVDDHVQAMVYIWLKYFFHP